MSRATHRPSRWSRLSALALALGSLACALGPATQPASAAGAITVTSFEDKPNRNSTDSDCNNDGLFDTKCSLRAAIMAANNRTGTTTIIVPPGTYTLDRLGRAEQGGVTGDLDLLRSIILRPSTTTGRVLVHGGLNWDDRLFHVLGSGAVQIERFDFQGGHTIPSNEAGGGGRVENGGSLTFLDSTISFSAATGGGGLFIAPNGTVALRNGSEFRSNTAQSNDGGGVLSDGSLEITSSSVTNNFSFGNGGGVAIRAGTVTMTNATITDNTVFNLGGGGGISNAATLVVTTSVIEGNKSGALGGGGVLNLPTGFTTIDRVHIASNIAGPVSQFLPATQPGGGVRSQGGLVVISASSIISNHAGPGGGLHVGGGEMSVRNSTISGNSAHVAGGGAFYQSGLLRLSNSTIADNRVVGGTSDREGGGMKGVSSAGLTLVNTIVANNVAAANPDCAATVISLGVNLVENPTGCTGLSNSDRVQLDPNLAPLSFGQRPFHLPNPGSPVIDRGSTSPIGSTAGCEATDQRGLTRPRDGDGVGQARCDIGAIEV